MTTDWLEIDGSSGEGGGQILRTSLGLASALWGDRGKGLRIVNIRANRPRPGLRPQHLAAVAAAAAVTNAQVQGDQLNSGTLTFIPGPPRAGRYRFDVGTAGSAMLVFQTIVPALLVADGDSEVVVSGGTHNPMAPCFEYVRDVIVTLAEGIGASIGLELLQAGFYPVGGGQVRCRVRGLGGREHLAGLRMLSRGELRYVEGLSAATTSLPAHIVERQAAQATGRLREAGIRGSVEQASLQAPSPGTVVFLRAVSARSVAGFFALGRKGISAEKVADEAADELVAFLDADGALDPHAADQLVTVLALSHELSELTTTRITHHLLTNVEVIRRLTGRAVRVEGDVDACGKVVLEAEGG